jgi:hypothetical protein
MKKTKDILIEAVDKAIKNKYKDPDLDSNIGFYLDGKNYYSIIFDKEFAKSIWGKEVKRLPFNSTHPQLGESCILWQWHIKQMLLDEEPLKYLEKNLNQDNWEKVLIV